MWKSGTARPTSGSGLSGLKDSSVASRMICRTHGAIRPHPPPHLPPPTGGARRPPPPPSGEGGGGPAPPRGGGGGGGGMGVNGATRTANHA